jgi:hypothetical protein
VKKYCKFTTESPAASYIPLPRFLLADEDLKDISNDAKVLYALLLDRASISRKNSYIDPDGTIRVYFTVEETQKKLHRSRQCVTRIFRELEYTGLICRKKQGLGKPSVITLNYPDDARLITGKEESDVG